MSKKKALRKEIANIPNIITISRLLLAFPLIYFLETKRLFPVLILIIFAGISDYIDGFIARKLKLKTRLGSILDPLSDKIFLLIPLLWLCKNNIVPFWSLSLILFRELIISSLRATVKDGLPASALGKYKTFFFFVSLCLFFLPLKINFIMNMAIIFYWLSFLLTCLTFIDYLRIKKNSI